MTLACIAFVQIELQCVLAHHATDGRLPISARRTGYRKHAVGASGRLIVNDLLLAHPEHFPGRSNRDGIELSRSAATKAAAPQVSHLGGFGL
jgi:hypothetical protein